MGVTRLILPETLRNIQVMPPGTAHKIGTRLHEELEKLTRGHMTLLEPYTENGKKRCQSVSSAYPDKQCEKPRKHNKDDLIIVHQHGSVVWPNAAAVEYAHQTTIWTDPWAAATLPLDEWWMRVAREEMEPTVEKAREYGSTDLIDIGLMLARTMRREVNEEEAAELGVFFYLIGKIARWQSAIERGERPSDDTIFDIGIYCRMAQRIRYSGGWPGEDRDDIMHSMCDRPCGPECTTKGPK